MLKPEISYIHCDLALLALLDQITDFFDIFKARNLSPKAVPVVEAISPLKHSTISFVSLDRLRRFSLLSKTSGISDTEDSKQNEQAEEDSGGLHCFDYFLNYPLRFMVLNL